MTSHTNNDGHFSSGRERISQAAYELFSRDGTQSVGIDAVIAHGGKLVQPVGADAPEITARFKDPAGNTIGLYQEPKGAGR